MWAHLAKGNPTIYEFKCNLFLENYFHPIQKILRRFLDKTGEIVKNVRGCASNEGGLNIYVVNVF